MIESFVDLTYRGLSLGRRVKLSDVRPTTGYVEIPAPMPVGTPIGIITDDTVALDAVVVEIREQIAGSDRAPGMVVKPKLEGDAAKDWWAKRVSLVEPVKPTPPPTPPAPPKVPESVVVVSRRMTNPGMGVPALVDDGQDTGVMDAVDPSQVGEPIETISVDPDADTAIADVPLQDDGKRTIAMDAVDLAALGLSPASSSGQLPAQNASDDDDNGNANGNGGGDKPEGKSRRKRKRR